jgi:hypothetical protein
MNLELDWIYEAIGNNELQCTDLVLKRIDELSISKVDTVEPLTFSQWKYESDIESKYNNFHDEYGDAAALLSQYTEYHYAEYLERIKRDGKDGKNQKYTELFV